MTNDEEFQQKLTAKVLELVNLFENDTHGMYMSALCTALATKILQLKDLDRRQESLELTLDLIENIVKEAGSERRNES